MNDKYKIPYVNACIRAFAARFSLTMQAAFRYLNRFKGIEFLDEFYDVEHLLSINDAGVGTIGEYAFYHCRELKHVYNYAPEPQAVSVIFNQKELTIHVPAEAVERYRGAPHWRDMNIVGDL